MSVSFYGRTQSLIKSRIRAFFFRFHAVFRMNVDGEFVSLQLLQSKGGCQDRLSWIRCQEQAEIVFESNQGDGRLWRATHRLHVHGEVCIGWSSFLPLGCQLQGCAVPFGCCPSLCVAVSRGSPLRRSDGGMAHGNFSSTCWIGYVAVGSDTTTS